MEEGGSIMLELYMYWSSEFRLFMIQDSLMFAWSCVMAGALLQYAWERLTD